MIPYAQMDPRRPGFELRPALAYYAQRLVTPRPVRRAVAGAIALAIRARHGAAPAPTGLEGELATLRRDGIAVLPPMLNAVALREARDHFQSVPVTLPDGRRVALPDLPRGTCTANYDMEAVLDCPHLLGALNDPTFLGLAAGYLGCRPTLSSLGVRWSFPKADGLDDIQHWHRDYDDWRTIKVFIYLTDVAPTSGPHEYVRGSHLTRAAMRNRRFTAEALAARYGEASLASVTGPAGTTFAADVSGIHRGMPPLSEPRLMVQIQYSVLPIPCFHYSPLLREDAAPIDAYAMRLILRR